MEIIDYFYYGIWRYANIPCFFVEYNIRIWYLIFCCDIRNHSFEVIHTQWHGAKLNIVLPSGYNSDNWQRYLKYGPFFIDRVYLLHSNETITSRQVTFNRQTQGIFDAHFIDPGRINEGWIDYIYIVIVTQVKKQRLFKHDVFRSFITIKFLFSEVHFLQC